jgi:heptosyltransferase-1
VPKPLPSKILIVRLGAIGDVVNALVFAAAIKAAQPDVALHWAVHPLAAPLVKGNPLVDRVHVWERGQGLGEFRRLVRELRAERFDLAVDLQRLLKSSALARLSGAGRVLGYDARRAKEGSWLLTTERIAAGSPRAHMVEQYLEFAAHLGLRDVAPKHVLPEDPISEAWADGMLAEVGGAPILLNLGASKPANSWPAERFGQLAARLSELQEHPICLMGGPGDVMSGELAKQAAGGARRVRNLAGETSLRMLIALSRRAKLFIGCDTGPMHIAVASGCPVIALFGPADEQRTGPYGQLENVVRSAVPCAACSAKKSAKHGHTCMQDLELEVVLSMFEKHCAMV